MKLFNSIKTVFSNIKTIVIIKIAEFNSKESVINGKKAVLNSIRTVFNSIKTAFNSIKAVISKQKADDNHLPLSLLWQHKIQLVLCLIFAVSAICFAVAVISQARDSKALKEQQQMLQQDMNTATESEENQTDGTSDENSAEESSPAILAEYNVLYQQNSDFTGWLKIDDTLVDYPVMQCLEDENYYLQHDFYRADNIYGCLVLDNDSHAGNGTKQQDYADGTKPSTNLIVHGHMTKTGEMFGNLNLYRDKEYGLSHSIIYFDTLYEKREYQLISAFYSQVYYQNDDVFKYYKFFQADTQEEFDYWYDNIKQKSLYDTGVTAEFGDEFITLSCCSYHMTDGRFVVVAKRIK